MTIEERFADIISAYPDIVSTEQLQEIFGICKTNIYFLKRDGFLPYEKKCDRLVHYHEVRLMDALTFLFEKEIAEESFHAHIKRLYNEELERYPDVLTTENVMVITGYGKTSVNNWILYERLKALKRGRKSFVPRIYLEDFLPSADYNGIQVKSEKHKKIISIVNASAKLC